MGMMAHPCPARRCSSRAFGWYRCLAPTHDTDGAQLHRETMIGRTRRKWKKTRIAPDDGGPPRPPQSCQSVVASPRIREPAYYSLFRLVSRSRRNTAVTATPPGTYICLLLSCCFYYYYNNYCQHRRRRVTATNSSCFVPHAFILYCLRVRGRLSNRRHHQWRIFYW